MNAQKNFTSKISNKTQKHEILQYIFSFLFFFFFIVVPGRSQFYKKQKEKNPTN